MKKFISCLILSVSIIIPNIIFTFAEEKTTSYYILYNEKGDLISSNLPLTPRIGTHTVDTLLKSGTKSNYYVGIHPNTSIWRQVSYYIFTTSTTIGMNLSFSAGTKTVSGQIGVSKSTSSDFSFSIDVDQNRDSKLKVYTDFDWELYNCVVYDNSTGQKLNTFEFSVFYKTAERFIPYYR